MPLLINKSNRMKKILFILLLSSCFTFVSAQEGYHEHDGFYLSMSLGPVFGTYKTILTTRILPLKELEQILISRLVGK